MNIGIIGTRGIPNNYGGFEQFAEYLSAFLSHRGYGLLKSEFNLCIKEL